jgi:signal transduction histidine kinase
LNLRETTKQCFESLGLPKGFVVEVDNVDIVLPKAPLESVLTNLISNAVKHHLKNAGHIEIKSENLQHAYQISVTDDGPGIDPSLHEKIFMKFQTLKPKDEVEGSGLGLAVVEKTLIIQVKFQFNQILAKEPHLLSDGLKRRQWVNE